MAETFCHVMERLRKKCNKMILNKWGCVIFVSWNVSRFPFKPDMQCTYKRNVEAGSCNQWCSGKAVIITYSERVLLQLQLPSMQSARAVWYCHLQPLCLCRMGTQLSHKRQYFRKSYWTQNVFWFSVQHVSETFLILQRNQWNIINVQKYSCIALVFSQILIKLEFSRHNFQKMLKYH
jgi:hypothetical protein